MMTTTELDDLSARQDRYDWYEKFVNFFDFLRGTMQWWINTILDVFADLEGGRDMNWRIDKILDVSGSPCIWK